MDIQKLTKEQAVIITGFTGILCGSFSDFHADVEKRLGRGVQTFEMGMKSFMTDIKKLYEADFIEIATVCNQEEKAQAMEGWISVEDALPEYCTPVLVFCANANYKHDGLKTIVASYQSAEDLFETSEIFDSEDDAVDSWIAETSMFDDVYGGRFINDGITHWMPLPESPTKECEL